MPISKQSKTTCKSNKRDQYTIVLVGLRSKFEIFGEGLQMVNERLDRFEQKVEQRFEHLELKMDKGFLELKNDSKIVHSRLENHENRISALENC